MRELEVEFGSWMRNVGAQSMKANLLRSLSCFLSVLLVLGFTARSVRAGAAAGPSSRATQTSAAQPSAPGDTNIEVESWIEPRPGWLYVLDPKPDAGGPGGRIWLVDPETGKVNGSIRTGDNADFALSPDGTRLYVASITHGDTSELAAIDTAQGVVLERGTIEDREVANVLRHFPRWLFPVMDWRCEFCWTRPNRRTRIHSCSPPSTPRPAAFFVGLCIWGTAALDASSRTQPRIGSMFFVQERIGYG